MSTSPVTLDMSKARPIGSSQGVTLDMTRARPITSPLQQPVHPEYMSPLPTENIPIVGQMAQPFGEVAANLRYDPTFRRQTYQGAKAGLAAAGAGPATLATGAQLTGGLIGGVAGQKGGEAIARAAGAQPGGFAEEVAGDVGSLPGAAVGAGLASKAAPAVGPIASAVRQTADVATFERFTKWWNIWKEVPAEIRSKLATYPGANLPEKPPPELLQSTSLATGAVKSPPDPSAGLGQIPVLPQEAVPAAMPKSVAAQKIDTGLRQAVGNKLPQPGQPIYRRPVTAPQATAETPAGFTPVDASSAVKGFRYDPGAQELHITAKDGTTHVYGEVTQAQAEAFRDADSKGLAWKAIRDNNVHVAKISPAGVRTPSKGASALKSATPTERTAGESDLVSLRDLR